MMEKEGWGRAYLTIMALALILLPIFTLCAAAILPSTVRACARERMELPSATYVLSQVGAGGIVGIGAGCLTVIIALSFKREQLIPVLIAGGLFCLCSLFMLFATATGHFPLIQIIPIIYGK